MFRMSRDLPSYRVKTVGAAAAQFAYELLCAYVPEALPVTPAGQQGAKMSKDEQVLSGN